MKQRFVFVAVLGLAGVLLAANVTQAQSYFFGYYYPDERRFHTDQEATEESYDSSDTPTFLRFLVPAPQTRPMAVAVPVPSPATIRLSVPNAQARVSFENYVTKSTGLSRVFVTPAIAAGGSFKYHVIVSWKESAHDMAVERDVTVGAGETAVVDFTAAANLLRATRATAVSPRVR